MDSKICLFLFGIVIFTDAKPTGEESPLVITNENELQELLKTLYSDGKFDIAFSHHEDGPKSHHEDIARITPHDEHSHASHHYHDKARHEHRHEDPYKTHKQTNIEENPSLTNIQTLNLYLRKKTKNADDNNYEDETETTDDLPGLRSQDNDRSKANFDQVIDLLNELEKKNSADDRDDNENNDRIACVGDRCGRIDVPSEDRDDDDNNGGTVRCFGDACGRADQSVEDRDDDGRDRDDEDKNVARCFGEACSIGETLLRERRLPDGDAHIQQRFRSQAKKIKINDNLDAIILDLSDLENTLGNARAKERYNNDQSKVKLFKNIDISNLLENKNGDDEESTTGQDVLDSESKPIKAVVVDLSKAQNDLTTQIKGLMMNMQTPVKQYKPVKINSIKKENVIAPGDSKILSHNEDNNNVYVPKWLLDQVVAKNDLRDSEQNLKHLLPLTAKQKEKLSRALLLKNRRGSKRIFRRSVEEDVGVPFHLQIQGLGQVEA